jgi:thiol-disulfide isomerase/thioredoxin
LPYLTAAVVLVGILGLANLLFVIFLARRIRELGTAPAAASDAGPRPPGYAHRALMGQKPGQFQAVTTTGRTVSPDSLSGGRALIGFFSPGCGPCHEQVPDFATLAKTMPGGPDQVIAVVSGPPHRAAEFAAELEGTASVVLERSTQGALGPVARAFNSYGWPSFYMLGADGTVESGGASVSRLMTVLAAAQ